MLLATVTVTCILSLVAVGSSASDILNCIAINETGEDNFSCLQECTNSTTPCKTLAYVLSNASLNNAEVVLQGDHHLSNTLTLSHVDGLTIRSSGNRYATIHCTPPETYSDEGPGLLLKSVTNLTVVNIIFKRCGTLQYSTKLRKGVNDLLCTSSTLLIFTS